VPGLGCAAARCIRPSSAARTGRPSGALADRLRRTSSVTYPSAQHSWPPSMSSVRSCRTAPSDLGGRGPVPLAGCEARARAGAHRERHDLRLRTHPLSTGEVVHEARASLTAAHAAPRRSMTACASRARRICNRDESSPRVT
jgi:hypothetical protein